jgi:rSAM/selenodomain-associated transferase 1
MLAKAARAGLRIHEEPVAYYQRIAGKSKVGGTLRGSALAAAHILRTLSRYTHWRPSSAKAQEANDSRPQALCIVARLPVAGQTKTRLGARIGYEAAATLYSAFLRDLGARFAAAAARESYDLFWYYTAPAEWDDGLAREAFAAAAPAEGQLLRQVGADLGQRLRHAFRALYARGYKRIVVLGSDSPQIPASWVRSAFAALCEDDVVLGPARDGGYYLLGVAAEAEPPDLFSSVPMSAPDTCARTIERARRQNLSVAYTPRSFDVDEADDLQRLRETLCAAPSRDADPAPATLAALERIASTAFVARVATNATAVAPGAAYGT